MTKSERSQLIDNVVESIKGAQASIDALCDHERAQLEEKGRGVFYVAGAWQQARGNLDEALTVIQVRRDNEGV